MEDNSIIALYLERNERAIRESDRKYGKYCFSIASSILNNKEDAEECVNDTWLRAWNAIPPDLPDVLSAYLGSITRNLAYDRYRYRRRGKRSGEGMDLIFDELENFLPADSTPEDILEEKELYGLINRFLATLSPRDRDILLCRYYFVKPIEEIAKAQSKSPQYIRIILNRTLKKLKKYLTKEIPL